MRLREELEKCTVGKNLQHLKTAITNQYTTYRKQILVDINNKYMESENPDFEIANDEDYQYDFNELIPDTVSEVMSELGQNINIFVYRLAYSSDANSKYSYYDHNEVWEFIISLEPFEFLIAISALFRGIEKQKTLSYLRQIIKEEFKSYNIDLPKRPTVFIAISFDKKMQEARKSIEKAILSFGYEPIIIDMKEHNKQIVPEIFSEIIQSKFIVADLTFRNNGVYYEAGYAEGRGINVILTCNERYFKGRHFDVAQKNTIKWKDESDLEQRLKVRIDALIKTMAEPKNP